MAAETSGDVTGPGAGRDARSVTAAPVGALARRQRTPAQLLAVIQAHGGLTRAELSRLTGLSRSAVAHAVAALLTDGLVTEQETGSGRPGQRGRPAVLLSPARPAGHVIGIDFGHAHVSVAVADTSGAVLAEGQERAAVDEEADAALDAAARLARDLLGQAGLPLTGALAIGAGIPGPLDPDTRALRSPAIMSGWQDRDAGRELSARFAQPVTIANDADLGALGELRFGAARGRRDFLYIKASHGLGAGLVLGGQIYRGARGIAGEIGHMVVPGASDFCLCGNRGCLGTIVSVYPLRRRLKQMGIVADGTGWPHAPLPQHAAAIRVISETGAVLGQVLADLCNCLNPEAVILGGEIGALGAPFTAGVRESIDRHAQAANAAAVDVSAAALGRRAELMGAVALAIDAATRPSPAPPP
jgi:predicted NBD/HSP70 family sugar kinase